jgi:hypothetical protein
MKIVVLCEYNKQGTNIAMQTALPLGEEKTVRKHFDFRGYISMASMIF